MPVTKQAIKKVRQDKRKTAVNMRLKKVYKAAVSKFRKTPTATNLTSAFKALDRAAKVNVIHKNKASRLKLRLSKKLGSKASVAAKAPVKKTSKKTKP